MLDIPDHVLRATRIEKHVLCIWLWIVASRSTKCYVLAQGPSIRAISLGRAATRWHQHQAAACSSTGPPADPPSDRGGSSAATSQQRGASISQCRTPLLGSAVMMAQQKSSREHCYPSCPALPLAHYSLTFPPCPLPTHAAPLRSGIWAPNDQLAVSLRVIESPACLRCTDCHHQ